MRGKRILIVEDSKLMHRIYELMLGRFISQGGALHQAHTARAAIDLLVTGEPVDLILLDTTLPDMNGIELLRCLRGKGVAADVPVVIVSTEGQDHQISRGLQAGAYAYITKPFRPQPLVELLHKIFMLREASAVPPHG